MEKRRQRITEEDILLTESLIAESYGRLKRSVVQAPFSALMSIGETMMKHPFETAAAAGGIGIGVAGLFNLMGRHGSAGEKDSRLKEEKSTPPDVSMEIIAMLIPMVAPYIVEYLEGYREGTHTRSRD